MPADPLSGELVTRIRRGEASAWQECIDRYEGRLLAFVSGRLRNSAAAEDIVQETFVGFLTALPNYDDRTPIESFLFAIAAHKLTDHLRREGRRPTLPLTASDSSPQDGQLADSLRGASSLARSREDRAAESAVVSQCLRELIDQWKSRGEWERLQCLELLLVRGFPNKDVAARLGISEQAVANHKHFVVAKLRDAAARSRLRMFDLREFGLE